MDSHDELLKAFQEYYKANQKWITKKTRMAGTETRYWLSEIRRICSRRRVEIQDWRHTVDAEKYQRKQNQKLQANRSIDNT